MAKKTNRQPQVNTPPPKRPVNAEKAKNNPVAQQGKNGMSLMQKHLFVIAGILLATVAFLYPCLQDQFTNWDDPGYVTNNPIIKDISAEGIRNIFSTSIMGNYHPLTILTYAFDYHSSDLAPYHYHLQSLLFHLATVLLVYCFVQLLTKRIVVAGVTALLFGIHPMHVESVAWIAGRKDVVYGFFYMASCIAYLYYHRTAGMKKWVFYLGVLALFGCSLLSKPVAVILPITLLVIDLFAGNFFLRPESPSTPFSIILNSGQRFNVFTLIEKIPLLVMSVVCGYKSLLDQATFGALGTQSEKFNFIERICLGAYALVTYLWKAVVPIKLLCFYPYPLKENGPMTPVYYTYSVIAAALIGLVIWKFRKNKLVVFGVFFFLVAIALLLCYYSYTLKDNDHLAPIYYIYPVIAAALIGLVIWKFRRNKAVVFGVLFFLVNIALLLQFIPVGGAIIADRYSYIPYLGLFFILGWAVSSLFEKQENVLMGKLALGGVLAYSIFIGVLSNDRCKVWYDAMSLWRDEIEVEPIRAPNGYNNLGFFYYNKFNASVDPKERQVYYDSSFYLLNRAIELQPSFVNPYISMGELLRSNNKFPEAKRFYYKALQLDQGEQAANAYLGLGIMHSILFGQNVQAQNMAQAAIEGDSAIYCYNQTLRLKPYYPEAQSNYANFLDMSGKKDSALVHYGLAIEQNPDIYPPYLNRGRALQRAHRCDEAFKDFAKALEIAPDNGEIYYARSFCYFDLGKKAEALKDVETARDKKFPGIDEGYYQRLKQ